MVKQSDADTINIRPGVSILSVLRHLNYRPWYALAEFVDNSLQSFIAKRDKIVRAEGDKFQLKVEIELDSSEGGRLVVRDNAAGIAKSDYHRAFRAAEVPPDRTGLSEFGMGMKSAACWLAKKWKVRTKAVGERHERTVSFNVDEIVVGQIEELEVREKECALKEHYTELVLEGLHKMPQGRTLGKIKDHLGSIYRIFLRNGFLMMTFDGEPLTYQEPAILRAPFYKTPSAVPTLWRKDIEFDFGDGQRAYGFAALRERASTSSAGFALFRRNRLIQGSGDESYRPEAVFGKSNSYRYQRLFGEIHLEGFEVSHTKDGFRWEDHEETFLELLEEHLNTKPIQLLTQAEEYRVRPPRQSLQVGAKAATDHTADAIERDAPRIIARQIDLGPDKKAPPQDLPNAEALSERTIDVDLKGQPWRIILELSVDPAVGDWVTVSDRPALKTGKIERRCIGVRMSLAHPFMDRFGGTDVGSIEPLLRIAAAIGLAETAAREAGVSMAGTFRRNINELLRHALSNP